MNKAVLNNEPRHKSTDVNLFYDGETPGNLFPHQLNILLHGCRYPGMFLFRCHAHIKLLMQFAVLTDFNSSQYVPVTIAVKSSIAGKQENQKKFLILRVISVKRQPLSPRLTPYDIGMVKI